MTKPIDLPSREEFHSWSKEKQAEFLATARDALIGHNKGGNGPRTRIIIEHYHPSIPTHKLEQCVIDFNVSAAVTGVFDGSVKSRTDFPRSCISDALQLGLSIMENYNPAEAVPCDPNGKPLQTQ